MHHLRGFNEEVTEHWLFGIHGCLSSFILFFSVFPRLFSPVYMLASWKCLVIFAIIRGPFPE